MEGPSILAAIYLLQTGERDSLVPAAVCDSLSYEPGTEGQSGEGAAKEEASWRAFSGQSLFFRPVCPRLSLPPQEGLGACLLPAVGLRLCPPLRQLGAAETVSDHSDEGVWWDTAGV